MLKITNTSYEFLYNLINEKVFITHQLRTNKKLIKVGSHDVTETLYNNLKHIKNANFFKIKGICNDEVIVFENSPFKLLNLDLFCEVVKYLSLKTAQNKIQLVIPIIQYTSQFDQVVNDSSLNIEDMVLECAGVNEN